MHETVSIGLEVVTYPQNINKLSPEHLKSGDFNARKRIFNAWNRFYRSISPLHALCERTIKPLSWVRTRARVNNSLAAGRKTILVLVAKYKSTCQEIYANF